MAIYDYKVHTIISCYVTYYVTDYITGASGTVHLDDHSVRRLCSRSILHAFDFQFAHDL